LAHRDEKEEPAGPKRVLGDGVLHAMVECDPSVLSVFVLGREGGVSSVARSSQLPKEAQADQQTIQHLGTLGTVILGAATQAEGIFGNTEFILGAFQNGKILLVKLPRYEAALALRLARSANPEYVYGKISEILAQG
jgi:hypothetical protein